MSSLFPCVWRNCHRVPHKTNRSELYVAPSKCMLLRHFPTPVLNAIEHNPGSIECDAGDFLAWNGISDEKVVPSLSKKRLVSRFNPALISSRSIPAKVSEVEPQECFRLLTICICSAVRSVFDGLPIESGHGKEDFPYHRQKTIHVQSSE